MRTAAQCRRRHVYWLLYGKLGIFPIGCEGWRACARLRRPWRRKQCVSQLQKVGPVWERQKHHCQDRSIRFKSRLSNFRTRTKRSCHGSRSVEIPRDLADDYSIVNQTSGSTLTTGPKFEDISCPRRRLVIGALRCVRPTRSGRPGSATRTTRHAPQTLGDVTAQRLHERAHVPNMDTLPSENCHSRTRRRDYASVSRSQISSSAARTLAGSMLAPKPC